MKKQILLIDGSSYIFRAFYGVSSGLKNKNGFPTNAIFGFKNMLMQLLKNEEPSHCVMIFDKAGPTFRNEIYSGYKANRDTAPDDLKLQFDPIYRFTGLLNLPIIQMEGYEADDVIGTLAKQLSGEIKVTIISGDKDLTQLVTDQVHMLDTMKNKIYTPDEVKTRFGVPPEKIPEYLALVGDSSDNIPGASGIGPKSAVKLFEKFGSIEGIYENIEQLKGKQKENLVNSKSNVELSLKLTHINCDLTINPLLDQYERKEPDLEGLKAFYEEMDFRQDDFFKGFSSQIVQEESSVLDYNSYELVTSNDRLKEICGKILELGEVTIDLETTSLHPIEARIVGIALAWKGGNPVYVPVGHNDAVSQLPIDKVLRELSPVFEKKEMTIIGQNIKYEIMVLANYDVEIKGKINDTMLESYLLDANLHRHNLNDLADRYLQHKMIKFEDVTGKGKKQILFSEVPVQTALRYAAEDADATLRVHEKMFPKLKTRNLQDLYENIELPLCRILGKMERHGVKINTRYLEELRDRLSNEQEVLRQSIYQQAGQEFNLNSPQQLSKVLFEDLGITVGMKKTKTGFSTDASVLERIAKYEPIGKDLLDYRTKTKLINTYLDVLPLLINAKTGRIHTSYNQAVAATGRLASNNPNLQNIPIKDEDGRKIRKAFIPEEGCLLASADYSQVELRFLAHLSEDERLINVFQKGGDIHTETAAAIYDISAEEVSPDHRRAAKAINFGIIYGMGAYRLSQEIGVSQKQAAAFIDSYFSKYPGIKRYMEETVSFCRENLFVETMFQRRRLIPDINSKNRLAQSGAERVAINSRIQGSAADLIKIAMVNIQSKLEARYPKAKMIMQVHDELVFEVPEEDQSGFVEFIKEIMENSINLKVPLLVDAGIGKNWQEAH
ncbi:DNA polymerase I [bacterium]|nr:DNA polymerase I [bacterium]